MALIDVATARARVIDACSPLTPVPARLTGALGLVLAEAVVSGEAVPPFASTAMDGYALRAADTAGASDRPVALQVVGTLAAGAAPDLQVGPGQAVRIMTGAPIPPGADAVVMVERTAALDGGAGVEIRQEASAGDHIRGAGEDIEAGQEVFPARTVLRAGHLGVLTSVGRSEVAAYPRAVVGVLSTGDELVDPDRPLGPGQIRDSNRPTLLALVEQAGCRAVDLGRCPDREADLRAALSAAVASCDAVVTSGGVSVGDFDFVKAVLDELSGGSMQWMQVAVKPAKPLAFGVVGGTPVFGLPGNPVSSMVSFELFARPALLRMMGHLQLERPRALGVADEALTRRPDGKLHLVRVRAELADDGRYHVRPAGGQGSHMLRAMALADALALVPDGTGVEQGGNVDVMLLA